MGQRHTRGNDDAVVVGSGPNGLAAAIVLARAGVRVRVLEAEPTIGGGTRTAALTEPGYRHDVCSAVHPFAVLSPFFATLPLAEHGLRWAQPPIAVAHPLDDGGAGALFASVDETARALGGDGAAYRIVIRPLARDLRALAGDVLAPVLHVPRHPLKLARFGLRAALSARMLARGAFEGARARALFAGLAAHSFLPLDAPFTASFALLLAASAHACGWPFARGGSQRIAEALVSVLRTHGGEVTGGVRVRDLDSLAARAVLFDTSPAILEQVAAARLPERYRARLRRWERGPGAFKIDYALRAPVPWRAEECRRAGTVHVGGTFEEIAAAEAAVTRGEHPERPFVLVAQPSLFDDTRAPPERHTLWAYCHVPNGSTLDMREAIEAQIERFAPGFRDVVLARAVLGPRELEAHDANFAGGDISGGLGSLFFRPVPACDPYSTPARGIYLCSSSTPPGAGVHGMCGYHAARSALRRELRAPPRT
ncbi:MAG: NAD(P)/FAD-dependent oxidoreductase [Labilithrix sp.]|nr:NAD(P)/FAD-dependent oxidoreductase [Labilithrix sp.]MCW5813121.1 NAD(P)/FAD-dependent oxidoreductase [Labilithrix sp.]